MERKQTEKNEQKVNWGMTSNGLKYMSSESQKEKEKKKTGPNI